MSWKNTRRENQTTRQGDGIRRHEQIMQLTPVNNIGFFAANTWFREVDIQTPSSRLNVTVEVFFEQHSQPSAGGIVYVGQWRLVAAATGIRKQLLPMHTVYPAAPAVYSALPESYDYASGVNHLLAVMDFGSAEESPPGSNTLVPGVWYMRAIWEPNVEMPDDELTAIFSKCQINANNFSAADNEGPV